MDLSCISYYINGKIKSPTPDREFHALDLEYCTSSGPEAAPRYYHPLPLVLCYNICFSAGIERICITVASMLEGLATITATCNSLVRQYGSREFPGLLL